MSLQYQFISSSLLTDEFLYSGIPEPLQT